MRTLTPSILLLCTAFHGVGCLEAEDADLSMVSEELAAQPVPEPDPDDPPPKPVPPPPKPVAPTLALVGRQQTTISLKWTDRSTIETSNKLYRSAKGGPYQLIATWSAMTGVTPVEQTGLSPDSSYCYYMTASNANGTNASPALCTYTRDYDTQAVVRAQLRVKLANVEDAGTDDTVWVKLNPTNRTYLDYGRDDFGRGSTFAYDLDTTDISQIEEIHEITFEKSGSDGMCIESLELLINDGGVDDSVTYVAFSKVWGGTSSSCLWLDNDGGHQNRVSINHVQLRTSPYWYAPAPYDYVGDLPNSMVITRQEVESRIESIVGNLLPDMGGKAHWGKLFGRAFVEASRTYDGMLHIDLDLAGDVPYIDLIVPDPEIDIDFDLAFSTSIDSNGDAKLLIKTRNFAVSADFDWYVEVFNLIPVCGPVNGVYNGPGCITALETLIGQKVMKKWEALSLSLSLGSNPCPTGTKPVASVTTAGDVMMKCQ